MAKRINKNKVTLRKRQMRTHSKINSNSPNSQNQNKGSAKTSTPSSVRSKTTTNNNKRNLIICFQEMCNKRNCNSIICDKNRKMVFFKLLLFEKNKK